MVHLAQELVKRQGSTPGRVFSAILKRRSHPDIWQLDRGAAKAKRLEVGKELKALQISDIPESEMCYFHHLVEQIYCKVICLSNLLR